MLACNGLEEAVAQRVHVVLVEGLQLHCAALVGCKVAAVIVVHQVCCVRLPECGVVGLAECLYQLIEQNKKLPKNKKITIKGELKRNEKNTNPGNGNDSEK